MPSMLCPSAQRCDDFMSHPNAYFTYLSTGYFLYFTLPLDLDTLQPMRPQELASLWNFLRWTHFEVIGSQRDIILDNILQVQTNISRRLAGTRYLSDEERQAWTDGYGFPVFDKFQQVVDFDWTWDVIRFKGGDELFSRYFTMFHPAAAKPHSHSHVEDSCNSPATHRAPPRYISPPPSSRIKRSGDRNANRDRSYPEEYKKCDSMGQQERSAWNDNSQWGEEVPSRTFPTNPDYQSPRVVTIWQTAPQTGSRGPIEEDYMFSGSRTSRVENSDRGPEREFRRMESPDNHRHTNPSGFSNYSEYQYGHDPIVPYQPTVIYHHESPRFPGRESEQKLRTKATRNDNLTDDDDDDDDEDDDAKADRKERLRLANKKSSQKAYEREKNAHENKKTKKLLGQTATQQAPHSRRHDQRTPSSPSTQKSDPYVHRTCSLQEPTRLSTRPRAGVTRSSSYHAGLHDSMQTTYNTRAYQAYAEDSPEDSPRAPSGSWRDV